VDDALIALCPRFGEPVAALPMVLIAGVERTLRALYPSTRLVFGGPKATPASTQPKFEASGLAPLLDASYIVQEKNTATYRHIVSELSLDPGETWMVGNSPRFGHQSAIEAGLGAIFVPHDHTWGAEKEELSSPELVITLQTFGDLVHYFGVEPSL
jgi:putative hydrolase of the HAD superfamily